MKKPTMLEIITESYPEAEFLTADGFNLAIIGFDEESGKIIYSVKKSIEILTAQMTVKKSLLQLGKTIESKKYDLAREYFEYNVKGSKGKDMPIWCEDNF